MNWYAVVDGKGHSHVLDYHQLAEMLTGGKLIVLTWSGPWSDKHYARKALKVELTSRPRHRVLKEARED